TAGVYAEADRRGLRRDAAGLAERLAAVERALAAGRELPGELIRNDLEPAARALCPEIDPALADALRAGADHALVCGSGPTVIGLFAEPEAARAAVVQLGHRDPPPLAVEPWAARKEPLPA